MLAVCAFVLAAVLRRRRLRVATIVVASVLLLGASVWASAGEEVNGVNSCACEGG